MALPDQTVSPKSSCQVSGTLPFKVVRDRWHYQTRLSVPSSARQMALPDQTVSPKSSCQVSGTLPLKVVRDRWHYQTRLSVPRTLPLKVVRDRWHYQTRLSVPSPHVRFQGPCHLRQCETDGTTRPDCQSQVLMSGSARQMALPDQTVSPKSSCQVSGTLPLKVVRDRWHYQTRLSVPSSARQMALPDQTVSPKSSCQVSGTLPLKVVRDRWLFTRLSVPSPHVRFQGPCHLRWCETDGTTRPDCQSQVLMSG
ncbi:hypothetical protein J6590_045333 [Homalodisca vitripennis]|nr:hypothetical protein J6590_045333 [Homalodisca vitripennis]